MVSVKNRATYLVVEGILAVILGVLVLVWPEATLEMVMKLAAVYLFTVGVIGVIRGVEHVLKKEMWGVGEIILGILALLLGIFIFKYPSIALATYALLLGVWFIIFGVLKIFIPEEGSKILSIIVGILSILVGILFFYKPLVTGVTFFWVLGFYALIIGPALIVQGVMLGRITEEVRKRK